MIAADLDNTLVDSTAWAARKLAARLGISRRELRHTGSYERPLWPAAVCGVPDEAVHAAYRGLWDDPVASDMQPVQGAHAVTHGLRDMGIFAGYVTRRPVSQAEMTQEWLRLHGFPQAPVLHAREHHDVRECKSVHLEQIGAVVLIDDHAEEISSVIQRGFIGILIDKPYNRHLQLRLQKGQYGTRAHSLQQAAHYATGALSAYNAP